MYLYLNILVNCVDLHCRNVRNNFPYKYNEFYQYHFLTKLTILPEVFNYLTYIYEKKNVKPSKYILS